MDGSGVGAGVIFDLDGTLLDTIEDIAWAMNSVLKEIGSDPFPIERYREFIGHGARQMTAAAVHAAGLPMEAGSLALQLYLDRYRQCCNRSCVPFPGITDLLDRLTEWAIPMGILSNKPDEFTRRIMETVFDRWRFRSISGEREGVPTKPDPVSALAAAEEMGIKPERVLFVGDSAVDMETARRSGMVSVGVLWGFRSYSELVTAGARHLIDHPIKVLDVLNSYFCLPENYK